jgi:hypothetical protein
MFFKMSYDSKIGLIQLTRSAMAGLTTHICHEVNIWKKILIINKWKVLDKAPMEHKTFEWSKNIFRKHLAILLINIKN